MLKISECWKNRRRFNKFKNQLEWVSMQSSHQRFHLKFPHKEILYEIVSLFHYAWWKDRLCLLELCNQISRLNGAHWHRKNVFQLFIIEFHLSLRERWTNKKSNFSWCTTMFVNMRARSIQDQHKKAENLECSNSHFSVNWQLQIVKTLSQIHLLRNWKLFFIHIPPTRHIVVRCSLYRATKMQNYALECAKKI